MKWVPDFVPQIPLKKHSPFGTLRELGWVPMGLSSQKLGMWSLQFPGYTLPETNIFLHLKMNGWKISFLLGRPIFRGYVSFREGKIVRNGSIPSFQLWNFREDSPITSWWLNHPIEKKYAQVKLDHPRMGWTVSNKSICWWKKSQQVELHLNFAMHKWHQTVVLATSNATLYLLYPPGFASTALEQVKYIPQMMVFHSWWWIPQDPNPSKITNKNKSKSFKKSSSPKEFLTLRG